MHLNQQRPLLRRRRRPLLLPLREVLSRYIILIFWSLGNWVKILDQSKRFSILILGNLDLNLMICFLQCASPGIVASSEDCRKFWLCKEEEEGNRVLEVKL